MIQRIGRLLSVLLICTGMLHGLTLQVDGEAVAVHMDVGQPGQKTASFAVGEEHSWYIRIAFAEQAQVAAGITVLQTLSPALTLDTASICVKLVRENGEQTLLRMGEHFDLSAGTVFVENGTSDRMCVSLTGEGIAFLLKYGEPDTELIISYRTGINTSAQMGSQILGSAQLNLTDQQGNIRVFLSDKAAVSTGGFHFRLTDPNGKPLAGESFMLARPAQQEESDTAKELLDTGTQTLAVVYERFYTSADMREEKTDIAVTDENGNGLCYGLAYGTYYLVRIGEAEILNLQPVEIRINEASHLTAEDGWTDTRGTPVDNRVHITASRMVMPQTGGPGTTPYTVSGMLVIVCACLLLWNNRKRENISWNGTHR